MRKEMQANTSAFVNFTLPGLSGHAFLLQKIGPRLPIATCGPEVAPVLQCCLPVLQGIVFAFAYG